MKKILCLLLIFSITIEPVFANYVVISHKGKKYGLWDNDSISQNVVLPNIYDAISRGNPSHIFYLKKDGKHGIFDSEKRVMVVPVEYDTIGLYDENIRVTKNGKYGLYDSKKNKLILPVEFDDIDFFGNNFLLKQNNLYGVYNKTTQTYILPIKYEKIHMYSEHFIKINENDKWGLFDLDEKKYVLKNIYDEINSGVSGGFIVKKGNKFGAYSDGKFILPVEYDELFNEIENIYVFKKNDKFGILEMVNNYGKVVLPLEFNNIKKYQNLKNCLVLEKNSLIGIYNAVSKNYILPVEYSSITYLNDYLYIVKKDNNWGVFDTSEKNYTVPLEYNSISSFGKGIYKVQKNDTYGLYSARKQKLILPVKYEDLKYDEIEQKNNVCLVKINGKWGVINLNAEDFIVPPQYDSIDVVQGLINRDVLYKAEIGKKSKLYTNDGKKRSVVANVAKTTKDTIGHIIAAPFVVVGVILCAPFILAGWVVVGGIVKAAS